MKAAVLSAAVAIAATGVAAVEPVVVKGNAFFAGDKRFYIRGLDYQPGGSSNLEDPIAEPETCKRDIPFFKELGINTIRIYTVDNSADHTECMSALDDAGIYLALDVNSPKYSINRKDPHPSYNDKYLQNIFATMELFSKYNNTLLFFSGNEVIFDTPASTEAAPYVKAVTRDMKQYQGNRKLRQIPIGYSAADVSTNRMETAAYFNCGTDDERSDFFAFNDYSWCGDSSFQESGWNVKVRNFSDYSLPIFLSEHGCNEVTPRTFGEMGSLYDSDMTGVYSGGLVYEYSQEPSNYGLVTIKGGKVTKRNNEFSNLQKAYKATPIPSGTGGYRENPGDASECPPRSSTWRVDSELLPSLPEGAKKFMTAGAGKGVGIEGPGSQNAGGESTGTATAGSGQPTATGAAASNSEAEDGEGSGSGSGAAGLVVAPLAVVAAVSFSTLFGAALL